MTLPNLSSLPIAVCTATSSKDEPPVEPQVEPQVKRARLEAEKDLVLVLGGIAYYDLPILPINRFYARLAEDLWVSGDARRVEPWLDTLDTFSTHSRHTRHTRHQCQPTPP